MRQGGRVVQHSNGLHWLDSIFFLVFDMFIQEDEFELRCTLPIEIAWMDTVNQSIISSQDQVDILEGSLTQICLCMLIASQK